MMMMMMIFGRALSPSKQLRRDVGPWDPLEGSSKFLRRLARLGSKKGPCSAGPAMIARRELSRSVQKITAEKLHDPFRRKPNPLVKKIVLTHTESSLLSICHLLG